MAVFLLMVYTISFGHSIIPQHHHLDANGEHSEAMHCESDENDHEHISHDDHFDEGIWDFLGCLIENLHQELPADHHSCETISLLSQKVKTDRVTIQKVIDLPIENGISANLKADGLNYTNPLLSVTFFDSSTFSRRGPPQS
ncbi:MAG: hypothetical protein AB8B74_10695 [Crocinitomicaceae bacterium]